MSRRYLSIIAAILLGLLVIACGSGSSTTGGATSAPAVTSGPSAQGAATAAPAEPTAASVAQLAGVGDRVEMDGAALTVVKVSRADAQGPLLKAKEGNTLLIVEVVVENVSRDKLSPNPLFFMLKDADGFDYNAVLGVDQQIGSSELPKGDKSRGNVAFEVKKDAKGLVLIYQTIPLSSESVIRVAIPD
jgi:hypothetical protein